MTSLYEPEEDEIFDPFKGYEEQIAYAGKENWFSTMAESTLARNAFYQGFITEWERDLASRGMAIFQQDGHVKWIKDLPGKPSREPYPDVLLTRSRMDRIKADHMLGIGDGKTSI